MTFDKLSLEPFERKSYLSTLSLENARMRFRVSCGMVNTIRTNFPRKYRDKSLACPGCSTNDSSVTAVSEPNPGHNSHIQPRDSIPHILKCNSYSDLQESDFNPNDDKMLAEFFVKVVNRRIENGDD